MPIFNGQSDERCRLILASASPRRRELMERFWPERLQVLVPRFDEDAVVNTWNGGPDALAMALTAGKIAALLEQFSLPSFYCAVAADTLVVAGKEILGKPADAADAKRHLRLLSGTTHRVLTALHVVLCRADSVHHLEAIEETAVRFALLDETVIDWYIATGEPFGKAGSYGIQGAGAALVERIDGCFYTVMGLPVSRLLSLLRKAADSLTSFTGLSDLLPWT